MILIKITKLGLNSHGYHIIYLRTHSLIFTHLLTHSLILTHSYLLIYLLIHSYLHFWCYLRCKKTPLFAFFSDKITGYSWREKVNLLHQNADERYQHLHRSIQLSTHKYTNIYTQVYKCPGCDLFGGMGGIYPPLFFTKKTNISCILYILVCIKCSTVQNVIGPIVNLKRISPIYCLFFS